jgi:hypothetical protein
LPVPHIPHELGLPEQEGAAASDATDDAKTDSFLESFFEPHLGQGVPSHLLERTKISLSFSHLPQ